MEAKLVESLLNAIVQADGDALVMHVGERPFVVAPAGSVELSRYPLAVESMQGMLAELLPPDHLQALDEVGAVELPLPGPDRSGRFVLVAARGGDDIWVEIRRYREGGVAAAAEPVEREPAATPAPLAAPPAAEPTGRPVRPMPADVPAAVVVPLRGPGRPEAAATARPAAAPRLLKLAAARGATTLFVVTDARPLVRVDGEVAGLDGEAPMAAVEVETLLLDLAPEPTRDALQSGILTEWIADVPEVGRVRCLTFRDHRGPGGILHLMPTRVATADQLGLSREIQALTGHPDGLILVSGRRASGKSTLVSGFVDLINRTRSDHIITVETQIKFAHESRRSFVSQREVRGDSAEVLAAARAALREDPDLLVIEDLRSPDLVELAIDAAESGRLVIGSVTAPSSSAAVDRLIEQFPAERRPWVQHALARVLRGVVAQALLRKAGGGRLAARELLLNTPPVANLIAEGKTFQLPLALDSGRRHGMVPLNDALAAFVQSGATDAREVYRKAADREGLLNQLKRAGIDTSFVERLA